MKLSSSHTFLLVSMMLLGFFLAYLTMPFADDREFYIKYIEHPFAHSRLTWWEKAPFILLSFFFDGEIGVSILTSVTVFILTYFYVINFKVNTIDIFIYCFIFLLIYSPFILTQIRFTFAASVLLFGYSLKRFSLRSIFMLLAVLVHIGTLPAVIYILVQRTRLQIDITFLKYIVLTCAGVLSINFLFIALNSFIKNPYYLGYLQGAFDGQIFVVSSLLYLLITVMVFFKIISIEKFQDFILFGSVLNLVAMITGVTFIFKICYPFYFVAVLSAVSSLSQKITPRLILLPLSIGGLPFATFLGLARL